MICVLTRRPWNEGLSEPTTHVVGGIITPQISNPNPFPCAWSSVGARRRLTTQLLIQSGAQAQCLVSLKRKRKRPGKLPRWSVVRNPPAKEGPQVQPLVQEDTTCLESVRPCAHWLH